MEITKKSWTESFAKTWSRWTPPDRPSHAEIKIYEEVLLKILRKNKKPNLMVLGSTSEFRDLFAKHKLACTVVEYNRANYDAFSTLLKKKIFKEELVLGDWRTFKVKQKYDLILGDFCINVIPKIDQAKLISNLASLLKAEGKCMLKTFVRYNSNKGDLAGALKFYRTKMKHRPILESVMANMFKEVYNFKTEEAKCTDVWKNFLKHYKNKKLKKEEFDYFASLNLQNNPLRVYIPHLLDILEIIRKNANLNSVKFAKDWFALDVPILTFGK